MTKPALFLAPWFGEDYLHTPGKVMALSLGSIRDYEMAHMLVVTIRNTALATADERLVDYTLALLIEFKKWRDLRDAPALPPAPLTHAETLEVTAKLGYL